MDLILIFKAVLLGIIEGITEFLPISSTGHMILADQFIKLSQDKTFTDAFEVIIQLGAILSVCVYFFKKIWPFVKDPVERKEKFQLWIKVLIAFIPAAVIGLVYSKLGLKKTLFTPFVVASTLLVYGILIIVVETFNQKKESYKVNSIQDISIKSAVAVGFFQCLAMIPGTSRSAATIIGSMLIGFSRATAAEFSFFLAIPTMFAATAKDVMDSGFSFNTMEWIAIGTGFVTSFIVALLVIKLFLGYIQKKDFKIFGYYRIILSIAVFALIFTGILK